MMPDRDKVIKELEQFKSDFKPFCGNSADWKRVDDAIALLKEQDAKTGHWIQSNSKFVSAKATGGSRMSTCSNCGKWGRKSFSFCPHCGAKMDDEVEGR